MVLVSDDIYQQKSKYGINECKRDGLADWKNLLLQSHHTLYFEERHIVDMTIIYRSSCAEEQFHSIAVWKQWNYEHRTTRKTGSGRREVMSARDDQHLLRMAVNGRSAFSGQLAARWRTATGAVSSIRRCLLHRRLHARVPLYRIPLTANHRRLRLSWTYEHRAWQADWHQVVFSDESLFNLRDLDGHIRVKLYAGEH
ncbi:transposable element Tcb2 transposase [Trichonephila clavipes]|nr:transposable element Tcb2 transposase [Trichonephila clavipes]